MGLSFVNPTETIRLDVGGEDWIEVRRRLPYGAAERLRSASLKSMYTEDGRQKLDVDLSTYNIERMCAYIVDWSARKPDGSRIKAERSAFESLDETAADAIRVALDRHIERLAAEREAAGGENPTASGTEPLSISAAGLAAPSLSY